MMCKFAVELCKSILKVFPLSIADKMKGVQKALLSFYFNYSYCMMIF